MMVRVTHRRRRGRRERRRPATLVRRDDGVRNVAELASRVSRLPPLSGVVDDLEKFSSNDAQFLLVVGGARVGHLDDVRAAPDEVRGPAFEQRCLVVVGLSRVSVSAVLLLQHALGVAADSAACTLRGRRGRGRSDLGLRFGSAFNRKVKKRISILNLKYIVDKNRKSTFSFFYLLTKFRNMDLKQRLHWSIPTKSIWFITCTFPDWEHRLRRLVGNHRAVDRRCRTRLADSTRP